MPGLRSQWRSAITHLVTKTEPPARLVELGPRAAALAMADGSHATLVLVEGEVDERLATGLQHTVRDNPSAHLKHVIIGGDPERVRPMLRACQPRLSMRRAVQVFHLADGEVWAGPGSRRDSPLGQALTAAAADPTPPTPQDVEALVRPYEKLSPEAQKSADEGQQFLDQMRTGKPRAVWLMVAAIAVVFGLEILWGGSEFIPTLMRMGANTERSLIDQPWRLASSIFLHAGFAHVLMNGFVLVVLGGFVERIIGGPRLIILLALSGLGGSLASAASHGALLSVGASGAVWGVLAAAGVFGLRPAGIIPDAVVPSLRRAAIINLVLNLTVSFGPGIDLWAHLGGGIVGAGLVLSGVLTRGLPGAAGTQRSAKPTTSAGLRAAAVVSATLVLAGLGTAFAVGKPWTLSTASAPRTVALGDVSITLPSAMGEPEVQVLPRARVYRFGDIERDPFTVWVAIEPHTMGDPERAQANAALAQAGPPPPDGAERVAAWGPANIGTTAYSAKYAFPNGLTVTQWSQIQPTNRLYIDITAWPDAPATHTAAALRALESVAQ